MWYRVCKKIGLPYFLYEKGFALVVLGMTLVSLLMVLVYFVNYRKFRVKCINGIVPVEDEVVRRKLEKAWVQAGSRQTEVLSIKILELQNPLYLASIIR